MPHGAETTVPKSGPPTPFFGIDSKLTARIDEEMMYLN